MDTNQIKNELETLIGLDCMVDVSVPASEINFLINVELPDGSHLDFGITDNEARFYLLSSFTEGFFTKLCYVLPEWLRSKGITEAKIFGAQNKVFERYGFQEIDDRGTMIQDISGSPIEPCVGEAKAQAKLENQ